MPLDYEFAERFKNVMPFPHKADFDTFYVYCRGEVMGNNLDINRLIRLANSIDEQEAKKIDNRNDAVKRIEEAGWIIESVKNLEKYEEAMARFKEEAERLELKWKKDLSAHYDINLVNDPVGVAIFNTAWNACGNLGHEQVDIRINDNMILLKSIIETSAESEYFKQKFRDVQEQKKQADVAQERMTQVASEIDGAVIDED